MSDLTTDIDEARLAWGGSPVQDVAARDHDNDKKSSPEPSPGLLSSPVVSPATAAPPQHAQVPIASPTSTLAPVSEPPTPSRVNFIPLVSVVDFHHARGPEVERWFGVPEGADPAVDYDWGLLPFMALSDGAHASEEDFSYFTLLRPECSAGPATSLFGISCTRQLDSSQLLNRPSEVTRSTVQKAVVVMADSPQSFGMLRTRLSVVTKAWFAQREFTDTDILKGFQESLAEDKRRGLLNEEAERNHNLGMSLRELVHEFKWQTLVLLKCALLQPKMLFFGSRCDRLCMIQFSLISLIPNLLRHLQDCADPELNDYEKRLTQPTSLKTSDRNSLLTYMGLPLQIFGKGSLFGPYTPLQQLDILADFGTKSYLVGSTNSLLLQQRDRYSDILINLDDNTINITSPSLRNSLALTASDRRWIDYLTQEVNETWDDANPSLPKTNGYVGSEEFIRMQFEEYILALLAAIKFRNYIKMHPGDARVLMPHVEGDPVQDYGVEWVEAWSLTQNYRLWNDHTDPALFDIVDPKHPCAGGLTIEDVQRRIAEQVKELHLDEKLAQGREVLGRNLAAGREKASTMFNKFYADMEALREAQRKRNDDTRAAAGLAGDDSVYRFPSTTTIGGGGGGGGGMMAGRSRNGNNSPGAAAFPAVDLSKAQQTVQSVGSKAGAYVSSWAAWAGEKRKSGWGRTSSSGSAGFGVDGGGGGGGGVGAGAGGGGNWTGGGAGGWGIGSLGRSKSKAERNGLLGLAGGGGGSGGGLAATSQQPRHGTEKEYQMLGVAESRLSGGSFASYHDDGDNVILSGTESVPTSPLADVAAASEKEIQPGNGMGAPAAAKRPGAKDGNGNAATAAAGTQP